MNPEMDGFLLVSLSNKTQKGPPQKKYTPTEHEASLAEFLISTNPDHGELWSNELAIGPIYSGLCPLVRFETTR